MEEFLTLVSKKPEFNFTRDLNVSTFQEGSTILPVSEPKQKVSSTKSSTSFHTSLIGCLLSLYDPYYSQISTQERSLHVKQTLMGWCSSLDEHTDTTYTKHRWNPKVVGIKHLQQGLQRAMNETTVTMSLLCYMTELYHIHIVIVKDNQQYETTWKEYPKTYIELKGTSFKSVDIPSQTTTRWVTECAEIEYDLKKGNLYQIPIQPISKYKAADLKTLATSYNVSLTSQGKSGSRQDLYEEISKVATRSLS